jgi:UDP-N-acetylmuramoylalanine--D-glutamate ligase
MGLGRFGGGVGAARFAAAQGASVLVTDMASPEALARSVAALAGQPIEWRLGEHRVEDFAQADQVVVNPAVDRRDNRFLQAAVDGGARLTSEIQWLAARLPNRERTIGVTGSAGKSTVTAMIGHVLARALGADRVHVGGNLGGSLLESLPAIRRDDWVVLELSSFMLEALDENRWSPGVAVVTNIAPNHLDRHGSMESYVAAKQVILAHQKEGDKAVLGASVRAWEAAKGVRKRVIEEHEYELELLVPGRHNRFNAMLALTVAEEISIGGGHLLKSLADFRGLPHRLQLVAERGGVRCFDDSKSTTPQSATLAIESFNPGCVHAILGGFDKGSDLAPLAGLAATRCRALYTIGATGDAIAVAAEAADGVADVVGCATLDTAVAEAAKRLRPGDVLLLSPSCASWDQFENYEQRGAAFVAAVNEILLPLGEIGTTNEHE